MTKEEKGRIKLFDIISKDKNELTVADFTELFCGLFFTYFEQTKTGKIVKDKLTEGDFVAFTTGFINTMLSTLYINASKDEKEMEKRLNLVTKTNKDVISKVYAYEKK